MRIIGQWDHPRIKITLFNHNDKLSVKFEKGQAEIILKFKEDQQRVFEKLKAENSGDRFREMEEKLDEILRFKDLFETHVEEDHDLLDII